MGEVNGAELVAGLVVVLVQAEAGDRLRDDPLERQGIVVGALEEVLRRVGVVDKMRAVFREFRSEVRPVEAGELQRSSGNGRVGTADHVKFEVGDDAGERNWRVR